METKPPTKVEPQPFARGVYTTEFWITVALLVLQFALAIEDLIPRTHAAAYATITGALYTALRTWKKIRAGQLTVDQAFIELEARGPKSEVSAEDLAEVDLAGKAAGARPPGSGAGVGPKRTMTGILAIVAVAMLSGCGSLSNGTRIVKSVGVSATATRDDQAKITTGSVGATIEFRDGRDGKTMKPLSMEQRRQDARTAVLRVPVLELETLDARFEEVVNFEHMPWPLIGRKIFNTGPAAGPTGEAKIQEEHLVARSAGVMTSASPGSGSLPKPRTAPKVRASGGTNAILTLNHGAEPSGAMVRGALVAMEGGR